MGLHSFSVSTLSVYFVIFILFLSTNPYLSFFTKKESNLTLFSLYIILNLWYCLNKLLYLTRPKLFFYFG